MSTSTSDTVALALQVKKYLTTYDCNDAVVEDWRDYIAKVKKLQESPECDINCFWPLTTESFQDWLDDQSLGGLGEVPLRPRPTRTDLPPGRVSGRQKDVMESLIAIEHEFKELAYFHNSLRLCGGLKEYETGFLGYNNPTQRNLVICCTDSEDPNVEAAYGEEDLPYLLGDWERTHVVGQVHATLSAEVTESGQEELELRACQPWVLSEETGEPEKPLWAVNLDAGGKMGIPHGRT